MEAERALCPRDGGASVYVCKAHDLPKKQRKMGWEAIDNRFG
jgi:hypothetical protein